MSRQLSDLYDVQGLVRGYGAKKFPVGLFFLVNFGSEESGRNLTRSLLNGISTAAPVPDDDLDSSVTDSAPDNDLDSCATGSVPDDDLKSSVTDSAPDEEEETKLAVADALDWADGPPTRRLNIAFTHAGLEAMEVPWEVLDSFPKEFKIGMKRRKIVNGDNGQSDPELWEEIWRNNTVHAWLGLYARDATCLATAAVAVRSQVIQSGCRIMDEQPVNHLWDPSGKHGYSIEHFGFADGIGNPPVDGVTRDGNYAGGSIDETGQWQSMAAGEFVLGHYQDEIAERPRAPSSDQLATNSTFMVYRKLKQDVAGFRKYVNEEAARLEIDPEDLATKMVGRERNGTPLASYGRRHSRRSAGQKPEPPSNNFLYGSDPRGERCPLGSHVRRANPRDTFGFGTSLVNRHRMLRRGIPYGEFLGEGESADSNNSEERGLIFIALNASIERQFEFVQQQWINYGDSLFQGSDKDPIIGNSPREKDKDGRAKSYGQFRFWNEKKGRLNICSAIPRFVTTRGGEYFFLPSIRALNYLWSGRYVREREGPPDAGQGVDA